jgi:hypothetical protein
VVIVKGMVGMVVGLAESDCERLRPGWLAQPANAVSSLAYVAVGAWLMCQSRRGEVDHRALLAAGFAMVGVGVGSLAYHGPQPGWASLAHDAGVWSLALMIIVQNVWVLARPTTRAAAVATWRSTAPWMAPALVAYVAGRAGSPFCHPSAVWQFHALWHVLSAVALGWLVRGCSTNPATT